MMRPVLTSGIVDTPIPFDVEDWIEPGARVAGGPGMTGGAVLALRPEPRQRRVAGPAPAARESLGGRFSRRSFVCGPTADSSVDRHIRGPMRQSILRKHENVVKRPDLWHQCDTIRFSGFRLSHWGHEERTRSGEFLFAQWHDIVTAFGQIAHG
jgi:hypothetical protein